ncbi:MAG: flavin reductase family protein [Oscillospiraceae bacterium]|nr:flavin reductase family protein [Oscillospiraceae bacterium]
MNKKPINAFEYAPQIMDKMTHGGILVTTKVGDKVNPMTIGWGTIGVDWSKPVFQTYIREVRHTKGMMDEALEFTINVPVEKTDKVKEALAFCGTKSGRDFDKVQELGLTLVEGENVSVPAIKELPLTLECKVIYKVRQEGKEIPADVMERFYPDWEQTPEDLHTVYYGEIVGAYIIEN